jgi:hypothetical protein
MSEMNRGKLFSQKQNPGTIIQKTIAKEYFNILKKKGKRNLID